MLLNVPPLSVETVPSADLDDGHAARWIAIQRSDPLYASPFLGPGYTRLVGRCCDGVRVGILRLAGRVVGYFPFQLVGPGHARPVGTIFCDYQAVVAERGSVWTAEALLAGCGLRRWDYDHLIAVQEPFAASHTVRDVSPLIDLSAGFDEYRRRMKAERREQVFQAFRRLRQIEREIGPVRFVPHAAAPDLLDRMLAIKGAQWARSGWPGRFEAPWERALMHGLAATDQPDFGGLFTVLEAGGRPIAFHLGLRSRTVWHYWTTAYDPAFARYSPGLVMLVLMARAAPDMGLRSIDLGKGDFLYKRRLMTDAIPIAEGTAWATGVQHAPIPGECTSCP